VRNYVSTKLDFFLLPIEGANSVTIEMHSSVFKELFKTMEHMYKSMNDMHKSGSPLSVLVLDKRQSNRGNNKITEAQEQQLLDVLLRYPCER